VRGEAADARSLMESSMIISHENLCQFHRLLIKVGGRELPRQRNETQAQILARRGTLISLDALGVARIVT
jgi:hypothetical protein